MNPEGTDPGALAFPAGARGLLASLRAVGRWTLLPARSFLVAGTLLWGGWIWWHSSLEGDPAAQTEFWWGWWTNLGHAPAFALWAFGVLAVVLKGRPRPDGLGVGAVAWVLGLTVTYGLLDEFHQSFVPGRSASIWDAVTDTVGGASVLWISAYLFCSGATSRGLMVRLSLGTAACVLAALIATLND